MCFGLMVFLACVAPRGAEGFLEGLQGMNIKQGTYAEDIENERWSGEWNPAKDGFAVVGYLPEWRFVGTDWCVVVLSLLNHRVRVFGGFFVGRIG